MQHIDADEYLIEEADGIGNADESELGAGQKRKQRGRPKTGATQIKAQRRTIENITAAASERSVPKTVAELVLRQWIQRENQELINALDFMKHRLTPCMQQLAAMKS